LIAGSAPGTMRLIGRLPSPEFVCGLHPAWLPPALEFTRDLLRLPLSWISLGGRRHASAPAVSPLAEVKSDNDDALLKQDFICNVMREGRMTNVS